MNWIKNFLGTSLVNNDDSVLATIRENNFKEMIRIQREEMARLRSKIRLATAMLEEIALDDNLQGGLAKETLKKLKGEQ